MSNADRIMLVIAFCLSIACASYLITVPKSNYNCSRGIAVMTPEGYATTVCAP